MKAEEAIMIIQAIPEKIWNQMDKSEEEAIKIAVEALEKQIPMNVVNFENACDTYGDCPRCGESHWFEGDDAFKYCPECGQALDWSEEE